ncbi:uncharacterized protein N7498_007654 [Penicillium cinerascens]|uniref:Glyoxalase-like domain-containing protein n=1 Tax=Penicillium cinerascens TaxID=70096 RepID=A0A9W9JMA2_9EURO|nr:uncharacterized protein N7498_007654 [Penicillium cinerascens]KAJ5198537.1 hypothetical protein N7498_007654 [Penicillium cinerascens]
MSGQAVQPPILDHFVILVSHKDLLGLSNHIGDQFILAPGGNHAGGFTTNKLILLADGSYLEFIAFFDDVDPDIRRNHRWGNEKEGTIIDWAFTLPSESDFAAVQQRLKTADTGVSYTDPIPGGRTKPDGTILKWAICIPNDAQGDAAPPGSIPFWCLDRTPRARRVPYQVEPHLTQHPSGVLGVSSVSVQVPGEASKLKPVYDAIFGGAWNYEVPSGSTTGKHAVSLSSGEGAIKLVSKGSKSGQVELLPGLFLEIESF